MNDMDYAVLSAFLQRTGWKMSVTDGVWDFHNGLSLAEDSWQEPIETLSGTEITTTHGWVGYAETYERGTYWDPPITDVQEICRSARLTDVLTELATVDLRNELDNMFTYIYEANYLVDMDPTEEYA
jgi:hypothetical protein